MDFTSNYFEIFGLPVSYQIDLALLADRYHDMQKEFHPDRYAGKPAQEQRLAVQYASIINQAYSDLKSPLCRAQYRNMWNYKRHSTGNITKLIFKMRLKPWPRCNFLVNC